MEEDVIGERRQSIGSRRFTFCTVCGSLIPRSKAILVRGETLPEAKSEHVELCRACADALRKGDYVPPE